MTMRTFDRMNVIYRLVVQPQEADEYRAAGLGGELLLLPDGLDGLVPTRNWIWDLVQREGHKRFWTFDDNIQGIYRLNRNAKIQVSDGTVLRCIEDFVERFENVPIAGMNYEMFAPRREQIPPFYLNTRVYSNMLILTDARDRTGTPYRNRGVYNDDTDLCLRVLKDGWCTILFNAFLANKIATMRVAGGNTPIYGDLGDGKDGRLEMAKELQRAHPDVVKITRKWGRWQHHVDYRPFANNRLRTRPGLVVPRSDEYGMELVNKEAPA